MEAHASPAPSTMPYARALELIIAHAGTRRTEPLPLLKALHKTAAADCVSGMDAPSFRNSAMDGFAVRSADLAGANKDRPVVLPIVHTVAAGDIGISVTAGVTLIMTGAPVPEGCDAVIPVEDVNTNGDEASFARPAKPRENIRFPGEDVRRGQTVLRAGETVTPERIMLLAALGIAQVKVYALPTLYVSGTGNELADGPELPAGKIYSSNAPYLLARAAELGLQARHGGILTDEAARFEAWIREIPAGSVIVTTGAVSKGLWDFIPASLKRLAARIHFHRVNIRPGKPVLFATLANGSLFFGLPGNPVSAAVGFRFFVEPALRALQNLEPEQPLMARLTNEFVKKGAFRQFVKADLQTERSGELTVRILPGQESFKIAPLAQANAWAVLEEDCTECPAGTLVPVSPFRTALAQNFPSGSGDPPPQAGTLKGCCA